MKAIAVIPARLASARLPRKMLREIAGKALIGVVYEAVRSSALLADVFIATDSEEIMRVCRQHGWKAQMTSPAHRSGTERVHEVSGREAADVYINVQGDEPLTRPEHIASLMQVMENPAAQVGTLMTPAAAVDIPNPNAVKVVTDLKRAGAVFLPCHHSFRPRRYAAALFQAPRALRLSQTRIGPVCETAGIISGEERTAGTTALPGKWDSTLRGRDSARQHRS